MLSGELIGVRGLSGEIQREVIAGGGGTTDYPELNDLPQINGVELVGNKTSEELGLASVGYVDKKVSDLIDTAPEELNTLKELADALKQAENIIPTKTSDLNNDSGFITIADVPTTDLSDYYTKGETDALIGNINTALETILGV